MPVNGLNSGIDSKITFIDATGVLRFAKLESLNAKEDATVGKEVQINGVVLHPKFHQGWSGDFVLQRDGDFMDAYIATQEANYYRGIDQIPMTITQTITEADGTVSQWQYTNVVITLDAGTWSGTEIVKQRGSFSASRKLQLT